MWWLGWRTEPCIHVQQAGTLAPWLLPERAVRHVCWFLFVYASYQSLNLISLSVCLIFFCTSFLSLLSNFLTLSYVCFHCLSNLKHATTKLKLILSFTYSHLKVNSKFICACVYMYICQISHFNRVRLWVWGRSTTVVQQYCNLQFWCLYLKIGYCTTRHTYTLRVNAEVELRSLDTAVIRNNESSLCARVLKPSRLKISFECCSGMRFSERAH